MEENSIIHVLDYVLLYLRKNITSADKNNLS